MKIRFIALTAFFLLFFSAQTPAEIKKADLAGRWYSASPGALEKQLRSYIEKAKVPEIQGDIIAVLSPHAGYRYSGPVAAYSFKAIQGRGVKTVIIVAFSHRRRYGGTAVLDTEGFETPLGTVPVNKKITEELIGKSPKIYSYPAAFSGENSVEMEIPFLQAALKDFDIVLIAMGDQGYKNCEILGNALYEVLKDRKDCVMLASTDMCHYLPYDKANEVDASTISEIKKLDPDSLYTESLLKNHELMCGVGAVCATMIASGKLGADRVELLKYLNSGDTSGDRRSVVGYLSAAFVKEDKERGTRDEGRGTRNGENKMLNSEQRKKLLKLARDSINYYLKNGKRMPVKEDDVALHKEMGAFVTLHNKGQLRGCIGNMVGRGPFYLTVRDMAVEAATADPRFRPVTPDEMKDIDIEISALSPLKKIEDPSKIEMGKHGVIVKRGFTSGVYLPQVAAETGWTREEFMNSLCAHKAGMPEDAWKTGGCEIYIFTAEVFGEKLSAE